MSTIDKVYDTGVDVTIVGSGLYKADDVPARFDKLMKKIDIFKNEIARKIIHLSSIIIPIFLLFYGKELTYYISYQ